MVLQVETMPVEQGAFLRQIVGDLSGKNILNGNIKIGPRWSPDERAIARAYLKAVLSQLEIDPLEQHYKSANLNGAIDLLLEPFEGTNIYGILPSTTDSEEFVVLGAHYDSGKKGAPGAVDNATGIALIFHVARELREVERTKNVVLVFFDQEEEELIGSQAFADYLIAEEWNVHSIHCFDMVGWDGDGDMAMEMFSADESLRKLYTNIASQQGIIMKEIAVNPVDYDQKSTDFDVFVPMGFPVIGAGECFYHGDYSPYKDTPADTYETVDFDYLESCSGLVTEIIKEIITK